jgi:hypothetical protein
MVHKLTNSAGVNTNIALLVAFFTLDGIALLIIKFPHNGTDMRTASLA